MPRPKGKSRREWNQQHSKCFNTKIEKIRKEKEKIDKKQDELIRKIQKTQKELEKDTDFAAVFMATKFLIQDVDDLRFAIRWICIMFIIMILIVGYLTYKIYPLM